MKNKITLSILVLAVIVTIAGVHKVTASVSEYNGTVSTGVDSNGSVGGTVITAPSASPAAGTYTSTQSVSLSAAGSQSIRYTINGSTPDCSSGNVYGSAIAVNSTTTIKAISCYPSNGSSSVATFVYTINLTIVPLQLPSLLGNGTFLLPPGATNNSTPSIGVTQQVTINVIDSGTSTVVLPSGITISRMDGSNFDATILTAGMVNPSLLSGLGTGVVVNGALQWGLADLGLEFINHPISVSIFVGTVLNGQTLNILRSTSGSGDWTNDGITSPATCVVTDGLCSFTATKASYYVATSGGATPPTPPSTPPPTSSGGGGGTPSSPSNGDANSDGKVNILDFNALVINWGSTGSGLSGDFNRDGKVDILDFNILMINWTG